MSKCLPTRARKGSGGIEEGVLLLANLSEAHIDKRRVSVVIPDIPASLLGNAARGAVAAALPPLRQRRRQPRLRHDCAASIGRAACIAHVCGTIAETWPMYDEVTSFSCHRVAASTMAVEAKSPCPVWSRGHEGKG